MADKAQQQTLSVRISESLRRRLERARQLATSKTGETVSTSEIAKQFLESARDDRLEVVDLLADPTESLLQIRRKGESGALLSRAEWTVLAHYVRQGIESASVHVVNPVSNDAVLAVLDAFLAVYGLRSEPTSRLDTYYLSNLPAQDRPAQPRRVGRNAPEDQDMVRRAVADARRRVTDASEIQHVLLAARNLYVLLEEDLLPGASDLNRAMRPFWTPLWRLAARGHYVQELTPVRLKALGSEGQYRLPIPSITEGGYSLHFAPAGGQEFSVLLNFPRTRGVHLPISGFPRLNEFLTMVATLSAASGGRCTGGHFLGGVGTGEVDGLAQIWFRSHENGITFYFSIEEWAMVQRLFQRAWELADIRQAWDALILDYGEL